MGAESLPFFNPVAANIIQFITFPLEILGLTFVFAELKDQKLASRYETMFGQIAKMPLSAEAWITLGPIVIGPLFLGFLLSCLATYGLSGWSWVKSIIIAWFLSGVCSVPLILELGMLIKWAHKFSGGRALGGVGFLLAAAGTIGEAYQVISIIISSS